MLKTQLVYIIKQMNKLLNQHLFSSLSYLLVAIWLLFEV